MWISTSVLKFVANLVFDLLGVWVSSSARDEYERSAINFFHQVYFDCRKT